MGPTGKRITAALIAVALLVGATGFALSQSLTSTSDVRIVAQKLEDGRIEFGLEQDGERILPRTRFFPADARVGRWLKSSAVTIEVEAAAQGPAPSAVTVNGRDENAEFFTLTAGNWLATMTSVEWCSMHFGGRTRIRLCGWTQRQQPKHLSDHAHRRSCLVRRHLMDGPDRMRRLVVDRLHSGQLNDETPLRRGHVGLDTCTRRAGQASNPTASMSLR